MNDGFSVNSIMTMSQTSQFDLQIAHSCGRMVTTFQSCCNKLSDNSKVFIAKEHVPAFPQDGSVHLHLHQCTVCHQCTTAFINEELHKSQVQFHLLSLQVSSLLGQRSCVACHAAHPRLLIIQLSASFSKKVRQSPCLCHNFLSHLLITHNVVWILGHLICANISSHQMILSSFSDCSHGMF